MEPRSRTWVIEFFLQCIVFVVARPEEVFNTTPPPLRTNFSCYGRSSGFYADVEADCKVYHTCDDHGNRFSYRCPEETAFRQDALICDHARLVDCQATIYDKYPVRDSRSEGGTTPALSAPSIYNVPPPVDNSNDRHSHSFSRSFQVSTSDKAKPGFVFSASVFLRDQQDHGSGRKSMNPHGEATSTQRSARPNPDSGCNHNREHKTDSTPKNPIFLISSTPRPFSSHISHVHDTGMRTSIGRTQVDASAISTRTQPPRKDPFPATVFSHSTKPPTNDIPRVNSNTYNRDYPYFETLRSIQANAKSSTSTTTPRTLATTNTEIPVHALTMSLKPLVPNELEYDPYYPKTPTSTEAYYTASQLSKDPESFRFTTRPPWSGVRFEIPAVLPDLNTLEDLVDRRKLFYIPRVTNNH